MKKLIIGGLVGGLILFIWQALSWTVFQIHQKEYKMAPNQQQLISGLQLEEGQYLVPTLSPEATREEYEKFAEEQKGKPWAVINYHESYDTNMVGNMIQGLIAAIVAMFFVCWVLMKNTLRTFLTTFLSTLLIGFAGYLFIPYSQRIWFESPGATTDFIDTLMGFGLAGVWFGWYLKPKSS